MNLNSVVIDAKNVKFQIILKDCLFKDRKERNKERNERKNQAMKEKKGRKEARNERKK